MEALDSVEDSVCAGRLFAAARKHSVGAGRLPAAAWKHSTRLKIRLVRAARSGMEALDSVEDSVGAGRLPAAAWKHSTRLKTRLVRAGFPQRHGSTRLG